MSGLTSGRKVFSGRWSVCLPFGGLPGLECLSVDKKKKAGVCRCWAPMYPLAVFPLCQEV